MSYKIPNERRIADALLVVMHKNPQVRSQRELIALVRKQLSLIDSDYRVSGERVRRIGINKRIMRVNIEYNSTKNSKLPEICPVCRNTMIPIRNRTLDGGIIEVKRKCSVCLFTTGPNPTVPGRYYFTQKR
jgi:hypothetical protein